MVDYLTEKEQINVAKTWLKDNGLQLVITVMVIVGGYSGWGFYKDYKESKVETVATQYNQFKQSIQSIVARSELSKDKISIAEHAANTLQQEYPDNLYSLLSALELARIQFEAGKLEEARALLQWAFEKTSDDGLRHLIIYRLAKAERALGNKEAAIKLLNSQLQPFDSLFNELIGDILLQDNRGQEALEAYQKALSTAPSTKKQLLELKIVESRSLLSRNQ